MKKFRVLAIFVAIAGLPACATNDASDAAVAETNAEGQKRVCKYERTNSAGSRMERVCRWVDAGQD
ncbi:MAG: hypothetical protein AAFX10_16415 [Pseudomonadota bacterium]